MRRRVKKKYLTPMIHSIELDLVRHVAAASGPTIGDGGNASGGGGGGGGGGGIPPVMQSKPYDLWEYDDETYDDETAYEYGW